MQSFRDVETLIHPSFLLGTGIEHRLETLQMHQGSFPLKESRELEFDPSLPLWRFKQVLEC